MAINLIGFEFNLMVSIYGVQSTSLSVFEVGDQIRGRFASL